MNNILWTFAEILDIWEIPKRIREILKKFRRKTSVGIQTLGNIKETKKKYEKIYKNF